MPRRSLRLYIVSIEGKHVSYDMYDSFLVAAKTPEQAIELACAEAGPADHYFKKSTAQLLKKWAFLVAKKLKFLCHHLTRGKYVYSIRPTPP